MVKLINKRTKEIIELPDNQAGGSAMPSILASTGSSGGILKDIINKKLGRTDINQKIADKTAEQVATYKTKKRMEKEYGRPLPTKIVEDLSAKFQAITNAQQLKDEFEFKKYNTGPHMTLVPTIALQVKDPDYANFVTNLDTIFHKDIRKPITGAQAATNELNMLRPIAPQKWQTPELLNKRLDETIIGSKRAVNVALETLQKSGYDVSEFQPFNQEETEIEIDVLSPNGQEGTIPLSQMRQALKSGYKIKE